MYRIDFEYYDTDIEKESTHSFEVVDGGFDSFLEYMDEHEVEDYKIIDIVIYK